MSHASSSLLKEKEKEIQKKRNIKLRKIDKRKRKMLVSEAFHNIYHHIIKLSEVMVNKSNNTGRKLLQNLLNKNTIQI